MTDRVHGSLASMEDLRQVVHNSPRLDSLALAALTTPKGLSPLDQVVYLADLRATIRAVYDAIGASLQAALTAVAASDLERASQVLDVPADMLVRMAQEPHFPDVSLMRRALKAARRLPDLSVESICNIQEALAITGCTSADVQQLVELLLAVADDAPLDSPVWARASASDRLLFGQAVEYARGLLVSVSE